MGAARSGSTLLGLLVGQVEDVFYAGELSDWPERGGLSSITQSQAFWQRIRQRVDVPPDAGLYKRLFEHPAGVGRALFQRRRRARYERLTMQVLRAVASESGCSTIVDSSHYPLRCRTLRQILGRQNVRLIYLVRRPSAVARSFAKTGDKEWLAFNVYLMAVSLLSWLTYLTHPRDQRVIVSYEKLTVAPLRTGALALGRALDGVDPSRMTVGPILAGNRFVKTAKAVEIRAVVSADVTIRERLVDLLQWPTLLAQALA